MKLPKSATVAAGMVPLEIWTRNEELKLFIM